MRNYILIATAVFFATPAYPLEITFTNNQWSEVFATQTPVTDARFQNTNGTSDCVDPGNPVLSQDQADVGWAALWQGQSGVVVIRPPGDGDQGAGGDGRHAQLTYTFPPQDQVRIGFLVYVGTEFAAAGDAHNSGLIKWIGFKPAWTGLVALRKCSTAGDYFDTYAPGVTDLTYYYHYGGTTNRCEPPLINFGDGSGMFDRAGQWVWVEILLDAVNSLHAVYFWTADGQLSGEGWSVAISTGQTTEVDLGAYWNNRHCDGTATGSDTSRAEAKLYFDNIVIRNDNTIIGPPAGFGNPSISSATIEPDGMMLTLVANEPLSQGAGYNDSDLNMDCSASGNDLELTYVSGNGTATLVYTIGGTIQNNETCDLDFNGDTDSLEDADGHDLAAIMNQSVSNNSSADETGSSEGDTASGSNGGCFLVH